MSEIRLGNTLERLAYEQQEEDHKFKIPFSELTSVNSEFNNFMASHVFEQCCQVLECNKSRGLAKYDPEKYMRYALGRVNEDFMWYKERESSQNTPDKMLLSPGRTLEAYQALYPGVPIYTRPMRLHELRNIPISDWWGLQVMPGDYHDPHLKGVYEATLRKDKIVYNKKYDHYKRDLRQSPDLAYSELFILVTQDADKPKKPKPNLHVKQMGFHNDDIYGLVDELSWTLPTMVQVRRDLAKLIRARANMQRWDWIPVL
jgi:hypothetical protein